MHEYNITKNQQNMGHYASEMLAEPTPEEVALQKRWVKVGNKLEPLTLGCLKVKYLPLLMRFYDGKKQLGDLEELEKLLFKRRRPSGPQKVKRPLTMIRDHSYKG